MDVDPALVGSYAYVRVMFAYLLDEDLLQKRLAPPWRVWSDQGFNLAVGFNRVLGVETAEGEIAPESVNNLYVPFQIPAKNEQTGETANIWFFVLTVRPDELAGWGSHAGSIASEARFEYSTELMGHDQSLSVRERYRVASDLGTVRLETDYEPGVPEYFRWSSSIGHPQQRSAILRYENEDLQDTVHDPSEGIDRVRDFTFEVRVPTLDDLFAEAPDPLMVVSVPWSRRQVYRLPNDG